MRRYEYVASVQVIGRFGVRDAAGESRPWRGPAALDYRLCEVALVAVTYEKKMAARGFARFRGGLGQGGRSVPRSESADKAYDDLALDAERLANSAAASSRSK